MFGDEKDKLITDRGTVSLKNATFANIVDTSDVFRSVQIKLCDNIGSSAGLSV